MVRLWPTAWTVAGVLIVSLGCANQNIQGRWRGSFPLEEAKACVLNLYGNSRFDLACQDHRWVGGGRYEEGDGTLRLHFEVLVSQGEQLKQAPELTLKARQEGNRLILSSDSEARYALSRSMN